MSAVIYTTPPGIAVKAAAINLAQGAGTYDLVTAASALVVYGCNLYVATAGVGLVSVAIQSNTTVPFVVLSATDGAVANLVLGTNLSTTWTQAQPFYMPAGSKVQYTIVGTGSAGSIVASLFYAGGVFS